MIEPSDHVVFEEFVISNTHAEFYQVLENGIDAVKRDQTDKKFFFK